MKQGIVIGFLVAVLVCVTGFVGWYFGYRSGYIDGFSSTQVVREDLDVSIKEQVQEQVVEGLWRAQPPLWVIEGQVLVEGFLIFWEELSQLRGYPLVAGVEGHIDWIRASNSIFFISPEELECLAEKVPSSLMLLIENGVPLETFISLGE